MRNWMLGLLVSLVALPVYGQVTITGMTLEDVTIDASPLSAAAEDWTSYFVAIYDFESSGSPWANHTNASGGSGCDMTITGGTPTRDITTYAEKTASVYIEDQSAEGDLLASTCNDLDDDLDNVSITWGLWSYHENDSYDTMWGYATSGTGYQMKRDSSGDRIQCSVGRVHRR